MSSLVQNIENTQFERDQFPVSFVDIVNAVGKHFNNTTAKIGKTGINRNRETGETEIKISLEATAKEVLQMLKGLKSIEGERKIEDTSDFGRRLKDVGILLSREEVVQSSSKAKQLASDIYALGCSIRGENVRDGVDISKKKLSKGTQAYKDELFLWAIGRDNPDSKYAQNLYKGKRIHSVDRDYVGDRLVKEQRELKAKRNQDTIRHKDLLLKYFVQGIETKGISETTRSALETTFLSASRQAVLSILTKNAWKNWKDNLKIPPEQRHQYIDDKILEAFKLTPGFGNESLRISTAVDELAKSEKWKGLSDIEKVRDIWDVCQSYENKETWSPTKAIETRELECQLKSFLAGNLIKEHMEGVQVAAWYESEHTKLALRVEGTNYMFDAIAQKEELWIRNISVTANSDYYESDGIGITPEINQALDRYFKTGIEQTIPTEKGGYLSVGDFDKTIVAGILSNIVNDFITDKETKIALYRLAIEINPNYVGAYYNLANLLPPEEAIPLYRKAIKINPNYAKAYYGLAYSIYQNLQIQTKETLEEGLRSINKTLELWKNDKKQNQKINYLVGVPKFKAYFEEKLAELKR